ncbi:MAG TPA: hypothetical protein VGP88_03600 [Thermoplasmata archaeon]|nr:hypothetical protein [Thermoplasmata archaeon]
MRRSNRAGPSAADATRQYIDEHPSVREALRDDLVNYTALARRVEAETGVTSEEAVTVAVRRYQRGLSLEDPAIEKVRQLVRESRLEVHARVAIVRLRDDWEAVDELLALGRRVLTEAPGRRLFEILIGTRAITVLCEETLLAEVKSTVPVRLVLGIERGLSVLAFRSRPEVAEIPGVLAYMAEALFRGGINCLETVSVHTDSLFVFRDRDSIRAFQVLSTLVPPGAVVTPE